MILPWGYQAVSACRSALQSIPAVPHRDDTSCFSTPPPVRPTISPARTPRSPRMSVRPLPLHRDCHGIAGKHPRAHRLGTPCRTDYRSETEGDLFAFACSALCSFSTFDRVTRRIPPISSAFSTSNALLEPRPLRSTGITRYPHYYRPLRHPTRPGLLLAESRLRFTPPHHRGFPCCLSFPLSAMPSSLPRWDHWDSVARRFLFFRSFPQRRRPSPNLRRVGSHITRFEACSGVHSRYGLVCSLTFSFKGLFPECFSSIRYLLEPPQVLPAGAIVAGRVSHPPNMISLSRRTEKCGLGFHAGHQLHKATAH